MKVLLVSPDPASREATSLAVAGLERRLGEPVEFIWTGNGEKGIDAVWRNSPDVVVADEIVSRAGAFALAKEIRGDEEPFGGVVVILLERKQDAWLAEWSGADAWFVKPIDPFALADRILELAEARETA